MRATLAMMAALVMAASPALAQSHHTGGRSVSQVYAVLYGYDEDGVGHVLQPESEDHQWPGVYFETRFKGRDLEAYLMDNHNRYRLQIDNDAPVVWDCGQITCSQGIPQKVHLKKGGWHTARLEALTESFAEPQGFEGFNTPGGKLEAVAPRARQVEIIGDSYAAGYGTTSAKRECTQEEIRLTTDTQQAFGALLGKHYDADYQINAVSGIGMVRNYGGNDGAHPPLPDIYPYVLFDKSVAYDDPSWQPQVVVIALGDNDFATEVQPGEKWPDKATLVEDFIATSVSFVQSVRAKNPKATFVLMDFNEDALPGYLQTVADRLKAAGETRVLLYHPSGGAFEQTGCDWHLSLNDHQRLATGLEALIDAQPDIWQGQ